MVQVSRWLLWATSPLHNFSCNYDRFTKWTASASRYWVFKDTKENCYMMINLLAWIQLNIFQRELIQILPLFSYSLRIPHDHTKTKIFWGNFQIFVKCILCSRYWSRCWENSKGNCRQSGCFWILFYLESDVFGAS